MLRLAGIIPTAKSPAAGTAQIVPIVESRSLLPRPPQLLPLLSAQFMYSKLLREADGQLFRESLLCSSNYKECA